MTAAIVWERGTLRIVAVHVGHCGGIGCSNDHVAFVLEKNTQDSLGADSWGQVETDSGEADSITRALICEIASQHMGAIPKWARAALTEEMSRLSSESTVAKRSTLS